MNDNGAKVYTRAGSFRVDDSNYIVNGAGQRLTGLLSDGAGVITGASGDLQVDTANLKPRATANLYSGVNLNSNPPAANLPTGPWVGTDTSTTPPTPPSATTYTNVTSSTIYDSLGNSHILSMFFIRPNPAVADAAGISNGSIDNQWYVAFQIDNKDLTTYTGNATDPNSGKLYTLNFNDDGTFKGVGDPGNTDASTIGAVTSINVKHDLGTGANLLDFNVDFSKSTQFGSPFAVQSVSNDGYATGSLSGLSIDLNGVLYGRYTNGQSLAMGQIQLANFSDPEGLKSLGNTNWPKPLPQGSLLLAPPVLRVE